MTGEQLSPDDVRILPPGSLRLSRDSFGKVRLVIPPDEEYEDVSFLRALPLSAPHRFIMAQDSEGRDIGLIEDVNELPREERKLIEEQLEISYFTPRITRILKSGSKSGIICWEVETDRGPAKVFVRDRSDVRFYPNNRVVIMDTNGVRHEIPDLLALDPKSRLRFEEET